MKNKFLLFSAILALFLFLMLFAFSVFMNHGLCSNDLVKESYSPDGKFKAVAFVRDCGATTSFSPQVSIIKAGKEFKNKPGNAFRGNKSKDIDVKWVNEQTLLVIHSSKLSWVQNEIDKIYGFKVIDECRMKK